MKLTQRTVDTLDLPKGKSEAIIFDEDLPGFGLRMRAGGKRSWVYQFKIGNQHRRMTLGSATALSPAKARETASKLHAQVRLGRDPSAEKVVSRARAAETMAAVLPSFLDYQRARLKPRSMVETERNLKKNAKPLHSLQLVKIDRRTIAGRVSAVASEKGGPTANRMRATAFKRTFASPESYDDLSVARQVGLRDGGKRLRPFNDVRVTLGSGHKSGS